MAGNNFTVGIDRLCAQCGDPSYANPYCGSCMTFKDFSDTNRAWCNAIHRGQWGAVGNGRPDRSLVDMVGQGSYRTEPPPPDEDQVTHVWED